MTAAVILVAHALFDLGGHVDVAAVVLKHVWVGVAAPRRQVPAETYSRLM